MAGIGWVIGAVLLGGAFVWVIGVQRALVRVDELCKNALSQIGVQQNSRWDALTALADLTKGYSEHEYNTLREVIGSRMKITQNSSVAEVAHQENVMNDLMGRLLAVSEAYPQLKANETYLSTMASVRDYENNVRMSRMVYNDTFTKFNRMIRELPTSIVAGILGFAQREYLQEPEGKTQMPSMR